MSSRDFFCRGWQRLRGFGRFLDRSRREQDLDDEVRAFVDELTARNLARGMTADAARRAALAETGGVQQVREATREVWTLTSIETFGRDVRYALRMLRRAPGFALVVTLTMALGIGANVTMFSVVHAVLWQPLPYPNADRLVLLDADVQDTANAGMASGELRDLRERSQSLEGISSIVGVDAYLDHNGELERLAAASVSDDALMLLGAIPLAAGRPLDSRLDVATDPAGFWSVRSIVVSDAFRRRWFPGERDIVGRRVRVNNLDVQIIGVLHPDLRVYLPGATNAAEQIDVWFPNTIEDGRSRGYPAVARLKAGVSMREAQAELDGLAAQFVRDFPESYPGGRLRLHAVRLQEAVTGEVRGALWVLGAAVAFVLVISCVNVANLMLAQWQSRDREIALRHAVGGTRVRVVRQLLTETFVLVLLGSSLGLVVGAVGVELLDWLRPTHLPRQSEITVNQTVAASVIACSALATLLVAAWSILQTRAHEHAELLRSGRAPTTSRKTRQLQRGLIVAEIALSIVPLLGAGLMIRTFVNLTHAPIGFEPEGLLTAKMSYSFRAFPDIPRRWALHREAMERLERLPGVEAVSAVTPPPFGPLQRTRRYARADDANGPQARATTQTTMPGYFAIAGIQLRGRDFTPDDILSRREVIIVDERLANQLWPDGAVGKRLVVELGSTRVPLEVIGVTNPVRVTRVRDEATPHIFLPYHLFAAEMTLVIKTREAASTLAPVIRQTVESLGTTRPVTDIRPMSDYVEESIGDARFTMLVLIGFGGAAILLTAVGLYGTLAYLTSLRTHEFGVRMALGASSRQVLAAVAREGLWLTVAGTGVGLAGALAAVGLLRGLVYGVTTWDGVTLAGVGVLVGATALLAALHPAWRASRVNPSLVLRGGE